jgi:tetratricopeptide (TPR) repeat protein
MSSVKRTLGIVTTAALAAVVGISLFGRPDGGRGGAAPVVASAATSAAPADVGRLVEQFSAAPTASVVSRLEREARAETPDPATLSLLGLAYQQMFRESGDPTWLTRAGVALRKARSGAPSDPLAATGLAQLAVTQHRFRDGASLAREALRLDPDSTAARGALGDALFNLGRYREAFTKYDGLADAGPSVAAYARVAFARQLVGDRLGAIDAMELALEAGSGIPEQEAWAQVQYGGMLLAVGRIVDAESAYRSALELAPNYVHAEAGLARIDAASGRYARAAERLEDVLERLPSPQHAILLTDVLTRAGRLERARAADRLVDALERLLTANGVRTELSTAIHDLDRGVRIAGALDRARRAYAAAPSVAAADAVSWGLYRAGRCSEAMSWARAAVRLGTKDALFAFHRGMIERCLGADDTARASFREALRIDPNFSLRWNELARKLAA